MTLVSPSGHRGGEVHVPEVTQPGGDGMTGIRAQAVWLRPPKQSDSPSPSRAGKGATSWSPCGKEGQGRGPQPADEQCLGPLAGPGN